MNEWRPGITVEDVNVCLSDQGDDFVSSISSSSRVVDCLRTLSASGLCLRGRPGRAIR